MEIKRLGAALGAEVSGVDLTSELTDTDIAGIRQALLDHLVIVIRDQKLTPGDLVRFGGHLGTLTEHPVFPHLAGYPPIVEIRNYGKAHSVNEHWHTDVSFAAEPPSLTMLYAVQMPEVGGDTQFANQYLPFEHLSDAMQEMLCRLQAVHTGAGTARLAGKDASEAPSSVHPVVRTHPETGGRALYVCRAFCQSLAGMTTRESAPLLEWLFDESSRYEYTWRHQWRTHDLVIWDNRCTLHYAIHDHGDAPRLLHRCTVAGDAPR
jgi:taurine dioxygenase